MAEADYDDYDAYDGYAEAALARARRGGAVQKWINGAGAVTSLALIVGVGIWGYNLAVRDVHGVPVVRALEGPARIAPENPGGELALHQGMAVNEIAADGAAGDPAETLTLAPRPEGLAEEDQPMGAIAEAGGQTAPGDHAGTVEPAPLDPALSGEEAPALLEPLPDGPVEPVVGLETELAAAGAPFVAPDVIASDIPGVAVSRRPAARPGSAAIADPGSDAAIDPMAEAAAAAVALALAPQLAADVAPGSLATGTQLVQIGSYPGESEARLEWDKASARFGALMDGKRRVIEPAESGGQTFYRLRVEGFSDLDDARRFCAALKAENAECVPAEVR
ncbi:SPOR domain-containing protein [Defluviimonas salinarum]|uniref:SPOR domain-containing protein n=1 Tax=Defluviimonas salinarum TaxID=2992147 RepID=A0ABT3IX01_9RHOB|nr:SPOR domain-containing protein [Defluviimonas salinarum]MCW3779977.1 SPOR domain-containing protein [Defluviimonas salinarum]